MIYTYKLGFAAVGKGETSSTELHRRSRRFLRKPWRGPLQPRIRWPVRKPHTVCEHLTPLGAKDFWYIFWVTGLLGKLIQHCTTPVSQHRISHFNISDFVGAHTEKWFCIAGKQNQRQPLLHHCCLYSTQFPMRRTLGTKSTTAVPTVHLSPNLSALTKITISAVQHLTHAGAVSMLKYLMQAFAMHHTDETGNMPGSTKWFRPSLIPSGEQQRGQTMWREYKLLSAAVDATQLKLNSRI